MTIFGDLLISLSTTDRNMGNRSINQTTTMARANSEVSDPKTVTLDGDIWYIVFVRISRAETENASPDTPPAIAHQNWLRSLRRVSRQFNEIITPYAYHTITISKEDLIRELALLLPIHAQFRENISQYTRTLTVSCKEDAIVLFPTIELLHGCQALESFRWLFPEIPVNNSMHTPSWIATLLDAFLRGQKSPTRCMYEERGPCVLISHNSLPSKSTRQLQLHDGTPEKEAALAMYRTKYYNDYNLNVSSKHGTNVLAALCIKTMRSKSWNLGLTPTGEGKLPPMKKLKLYDWKWENCKFETWQLWDFSSLRCLSFVLSDFARFVRNVPVKHLAKLRTFKIKYWPARKRNLATCQKFLASLLRECKKLESFKIEMENWQEIFDIDDIAGSDGRLRKLRLIEDTDPTPLTLPVLKNLLHRCPNILDLQLNMPLPEDSVDEIFDFLSALAEVESLRDLTLRAEANYPMDDANPDSIDPAYDGAGVIMKFLHANKAGQPFNKVMIDYILPLDDVPPPANHNYEDDEYRTRHFASRINNAGIYEQWGSEQRMVREERAEEDPDDDSDGSSNGDTNTHSHGGHSGNQDWDPDADLTETSSVGYGLDEELLDSSEAEEEDQEVGSSDNEEIGSSDDEEVGSSDDEET